MKKAIILTLICLGFALNSCKYYSLTGVEVHPDVKTFTVSRVVNQASTINPEVSFKFQDGFIQRLNRQTALQEVTTKGDIKYDIVITGYTFQPLSVNSGNVSAENKFTITLKCNFTNSKEEVNSFEKSFTSSRNYPGTTTLQAAESLLLDEIIEELIDKVFNESLVNW